MSTLTQKLKNIDIENNIQGWFDFYDIYRDAVLAAKDGDLFIEIGVWLGRSACYMAKLIKASNKKIRFDCIDVWGDHIAGEALATEVMDSVNSSVSMLDKFKNNMIKNNVLEYVNPVQDWSWAAADKYANESVDFVFLDAAHDYESVLKDLHAWWPKIKNGGCFSGHDYSTLYGVKKAVDEFFHGKSIIKIFKHNNVWMVKK